MNGVEVRRLGAGEVREQADSLGAVLRDCVEGGASVRFMAPFPQEEARAAFEAVAPEVESGRRILLGAFADGVLVGTVQVVHASQPNSPHRGDVAQLLVHRQARRRGIARRLMERGEAEAARGGKTLLVLDTV